jgi:hypothetical protein
VFVVASLLAIAFVFRAALLPPLARFLDVGVEARQVDCVMALPGDDERRPFVAAAMANVGLTQKLLIPTNEDAPEVLDGLIPTSAEIARRIYQARGVPLERIVTLEGASTSTASDLDLLKQYLDGKPCTSVAIVTNAFHTRRTRWTIDVRLPEQRSRISVISAPNPGFDDDAWWRSNTGFRYVILEYLKLMYYWFRDGRGVLWVIAAALLSVFWMFRRKLPPRKSKMNDNLLYFANSP